jgi:hypothetical protein
MLAPREAEAEALASRAVSGSRRDAAQNRNACFAQNVFDDRLFQARGVVIEVEVIRFFVEAKALEPVGVREIAEGAILLCLERVLELVGYGHECHSRNCSISGGVRS